LYIEQALKGHRHIADSLANSAFCRDKKNVLLLLSISKMRLLKSLLLSALLAFSGTLQAQYVWDFGGKIGASNYLGDIGGGAGAARGFIYDMKLEQTKFTLGLTGRYFFGNNTAVAVHFTHVRLKGEDSGSENPERYSRNLSFRNDVLELTTRLEYHFIKINDIGRTFRYRLSFNLFLWGGVGAFYNNPKGYYQGEWIALRPLQTEGIGYSPFSFCAPAGIGMHYRFNKRHLIGFEAGWRFTLSDYIDDVSSFYKNPDDFTDPQAIALADRSVEVDPNDPLFIGANNYGAGTKANPSEPAKRGNPEDNDSYLVACFTYSYALRGKTSFSRSKYSFVKGRPRKRRSKAKF
jgi:hypothetical protein